MHGLQACLFKYITVAAFCIYAERGENGVKRRGWRTCIKKSRKLHYWTWKIMEKSWNYVFEFLWEPCGKQLLWQT